MKKTNTLKDCITAICRFPRLYNDGSNRTPLQILDASGYSDHYLTITQAAIEDEIQKNPELIDDWKLWTEDKRWTPSWGFSTRDQIQWVVHYVLRDGSNGYTILFDDPIRACALMIRFEMEDLRLANKTVKN